METIKVIIWKINRAKGPPLSDGGLFVFILNVFILQFDYKIQFLVYKSASSTHQDECCWFTFGETDATYIVSQVYSENLVLNFIAEIKK